MPKNNGEEMVRKHIWMYQDDWDFLEQTFGAPGQIGTSAAIRLMVRKYINQLRERGAGVAQPVKTDTVDTLIEESLND